MKKIFKCTTNVWLYPGEKASWHFLTIPKNESTEIKKSFAANSRGWGSLPVKVTIGKTTWETSIFPDSKSGTYLLPLKAKVRSVEGIFEGDRVGYTVEVK